MSVYGETMMFPDTVEQFMEDYKITDTKQVYTNGTDLVPIFRMKQWFEHLQSENLEALTDSEKRIFLAAMERERKRRTVDDLIKRQAVIYLDLFTKTYCRDESVTDDLEFRCNQCDFQLSDGTCLAKTMARKLCPDYREFGSMGDL